MIREAWIEINMNAIVIKNWGKYVMNGTISKDHVIQSYPRMQSSIAVILIKILIKSWLQRKSCILWQRGISTYLDASRRFCCRRMGNIWDTHEIIRDNSPEPNRTQGFYRRKYLYTSEGLVYIIKFAFSKAKINIYDSGLGQDETFFDNLRYSKQ